MYLNDVDIYYDGSGYYAYLMLNGDRQYLEEVINLLPDRRLQCLHSGRSHRIAGDGRQYLWFIRVANAYGGRPNENHIRDFAGDIRLNILEKQRQEAAAIKQRAETLASEKAKVETRLEQLRAHLETIQAQSEKTRTNLETTREQLQIIRDERHNQLDLLTEESGRLQLENDSYLQEIRALSSEVNDLTQLLEMSDEETKNLEQKLQIFTSEKQMLQAQISQLEQEKTYLQLQTDAENYTSTTQLSHILEYAYPHITFLQGSDVVLDNLSDPQSLLRKISAIVIHKQSGRNRVKAADGWWEETYSTGHSNDGRLYFACPQDQYHLLISVKGSQKEDVKYLQGYNFS